MPNKSPAEQLREITKEVQASTMVRAEAQPEQYWSQIWDQALTVAKSGNGIAVIDLSNLGISITLNHAEQQYWKRFLEEKELLGIQAGEHFISFGWSI